MELGHNESSDNIVYKKKKKNEADNSNYITSIYYN